jgi:hypothetical protein
MAELIHPVLPICALTCGHIHTFTLIWHTFILTLLCVPMPMLPQIRMRRIHPPDTLWLLDGLHIGQIDRDGFPIALHEHTLQLLVLARIDLLVRHPGGRDEVAGLGFGDKLQALAPPHARPALEHVDDALQVAVVVRARLGVGVDCHRAHPQLLRAHVRKVDRGRAPHAGRLRRVGVGAVGGDYGGAGVFPFGGGGSSGMAGAELADAIVARCVDEYA